MSFLRKGSAPSNPERPAYVPKASPYYYGGGYVEPKKPERRTSGDAQHSEDKRSTKIWMSLMRTMSSAKPLKDDASSRSSTDTASSWGNLFEAAVKLPKSANGARNAEGSQSVIEDSKNESRDDKLRFTATSVVTEDQRDADEQGDIEDDFISKVFEPSHQTLASQPEHIQKRSKAADSESSGFVSDSFAVDSNAERDNGSKSKEAIDAETLTSGNVGDSTATESTVVSSKSMAVNSFTTHRRPSVEDACILPNRKSDPSESASLPSISDGSFSQLSIGGFSRLRTKEGESYSKSLSSKPHGAYRNDVIEAIISKTSRLRSEFDEEQSIDSGSGTMIEHNPTASSFSSLNAITSEINRPNFPSNRSRRSNPRPEDAKDSTQTTLESTRVMSDGKIPEKGLRTSSSFSRSSDSVETAPIAHKKAFVDDHSKQNMESGNFKSEMDDANAIDHLSAWKDRFDVAARSREPVKTTTENVWGENERSLRRAGHEKEKMPFSGVAAAFYNGGSLYLNETVSCPSMLKINDFLKDKRTELYAGVPGKWLTVVLGGESSDLGTIVSTIMYSYFTTLTTKPEQLCIVPLINMARADLVLHPEVSWLFKSCAIDTSSLIFLDEISLSYYHRFGSLRLVLVNHSKLSQSQENLQDDVEEILDIHAQKDVGSTCTIIAESFAQHDPQILAGRAVCRLMLAAILLDTANLTNEKSTYRDVSMVTLLLNGAGRFGRNGLFKILKLKSHDVSRMSTSEILRKNFKQFNFNSTSRLNDGKEASVEGLRTARSAGGARVGMSSLGIPLPQFLMWESDSVQLIQHFQRSRNLQIFIIVTGYYETQTLFKREVLLVGENHDLINDVSNFFIIKSVEVKFSTLYIEGLPLEMKAFITEGRRVSRTTIQRIIEDFFR